MILKCFAVQDLKAGLFMQPFFFPSIGQAVRAMSDMAADPGSILFRHAADFVLYELCEWDDITARFVNDGHPVHICNISSLAPAARQPELGV